MTPLYTAERLDLEGLNTDWIAVDTETTRFDPEQFASGGKTRIAPARGARLILGSVASYGAVHVFSPSDLAEFLYTHLTSDGRVIFHNAAFDVHVLVNAFPSLKAPLIQAARDGRIHDTLVLEQLIRIGRGSVLEDFSSNLTLAKLARRYAGLSLDKSSTRLSFGELEGRLHEATQEQLQYAAQDAAATYLVYAAQLRKALIVSNQDCAFKSLPNARRFGLLAESCHVQGAIALSWLEQHPVRVDLDRTQRALDSVEAEAARLESVMCTWGEMLPKKYKRKSGDIIKQVDTPWARRTKKGEFKLSHNALRAAFRRWAIAHSVTPKLTTTGDITLERDFWAEHLPRATPELLAAPETAITDTDRLAVFLAHARLRLLRSRYLLPLAQSETHHPRYYNIGARTTRTSASRFPIQQVPKHRDGLRGLFVPPDGHVFIEADYKAAELTALAQVYHLLYGHSVLADAINRGDDVHIATARRIWSDFDDRPSDEQKRLRQAAKAVNFGLPGGMGPAKFALFARGYGFFWSAEEARALRQRALSADPQLRNYLNDTQTPRSRVELAARNLQLSVPDLITALRAWRTSSEDPDSRQVHWRAALKRLLRWSKDRKNSEFKIRIPPGFKSSWDLFRYPARSPTGGVRGRASYTEAHNFPFQSLVACAGKLALFNLWAEHDPALFAPVNFVHDSILISAPRERAEEAAQILYQAMLRAIREVAPDLKGDVDVEIKERWGKLSGVFAAAEA